MTEKSNISRLNIDQKGERMKRPNQERSIMPYYENQLNQPDNSYNFLEKGACHSILAKHCSEKRPMLLKPASNTVVH